MQKILIAIAVCGLAMPTGLAARLEAGATQQDKSSIHSPRPPSNWWKTERYIQELRLTAEQSAQINEIVQTSFSRLKADKEDLDRAQSDFRAAHGAPERKPARAAEGSRAARDGEILNQ